MAVNTLQRGASLGDIGNSSEYSLPNPILDNEVEQGPVETIPLVIDCMGVAIETQNPTTEHTTSPATLSSLPTTTEPHPAWLNQNNSEFQEHCRLHPQWRVDPQLKLGFTQTYHAENRANLFMLPPRRISSVNALTSSRYATPSTPTNTAIKTKHRSLGTTSNTHSLRSFNKPPPLPQYFRLENQNSPRQPLSSSPCISFVATAANYKDETEIIIETPIDVSTARSIAHHGNKARVRMSSIGKHFPPPPCPPPNYPPPRPPPQKRSQHIPEETLSSATGI
ncbi:hypothetical protein F4859DRAFT_510756 [Xylaria cf. heliscus]|nr:hypothetical protein F4859DRAFT_510756 [Xylaria cf. heliscus]